MREQTAVPNATMRLLALGWLAVAFATAAGVDLSLIDVLALFGVVVILPLAIGGSGLGWLAAAGATAASFLAPTGPAAVLVVPLLAMTSLSLLTAVRIQIAARTLDAATATLVRLYAVVAAGALAQSRLGVVVLDVHEPIVELTAVHYMFAGAAALQLARSAFSTGSPARLAIVGLAATAVAPPLVAAGFLTSHALPQVGGAVLMTLGVWCTATLQLRAARDPRLDTRTRALLLTSGLAIWAPMVLAVAWAAAQHWTIPALSIPAMARTHGIANAFGFALCGLLARRFEAASSRRRPGYVEAGAPSRSAASRRSRP